MQITKYRHGNLKPEKLDPLYHMIDKILTLSEDNPTDKDDVKHWKSMAVGFVVAAMPGYLQPIVSDRHFKEFLQQKQYASVADRLLHQLRVEHANNLSDHKS